MLKKVLAVASILFLSSALSGGCECDEFSPEPSAPVVHQTKIVVSFTGNHTLNTVADPQAGETVTVTLDGDSVGTATSAQPFSKTVDTGTHVVVLKSHIVNSTYSFTQDIAYGESDTLEFNCGDAHVTFNTDAAWALDGVSKLTIAYVNAHPAPPTSAFSITLAPGEQATSSVDVQAGSTLFIGDQNGKLLKKMVLNVAYDATTPFTISYP